MENLRKSLETARAKGVEVRGIAVINPGNPTGNILAEEQIKDIIQVWIIDSGLMFNFWSNRPAWKTLGCFFLGLITLYAAEKMLECLGRGSTRGGAGVTTHARLGIV